MVAFGPAARCQCGYSFENDHGTYAGHKCTRSAVHIRVTEEVCPDLSRLNRSDRRAVESIAKRYGWKMKST